MGCQRVCSFLVCVCLGAGEHSGLVYGFGCDEMGYENVVVCDHVVWLVVCLCITAAISSSVFAKGVGYLFWYAYVAGHVLDSYG